MKQQEREREREREERERDERERVSVCERNTETTKPTNSEKVRETG